MLKWLGVGLFLYPFIGLAQTVDDRVESGRYEVHGPVEAPKVKKKQVKRKPVSTTAPTAAIPTSEEPSLQAASSGAADAAEKSDESERVEAPSYSVQLQDLISGKPQAIEAYKQQIHPDDVRLNRLEINFTPGVLYYDSRANYSFRNCQSFSPIVRLGGEVWWTPLIGIYGSYGQTYGADVVDDGRTRTRERVTHELIEAGFDFRKFFGLSRRSNSIVFGVHYGENKFTVRADSTSRTNTKSSGLGLHFGARIPTAPSYAWTFMAKIEPKVVHSEFGTALNLNSGASPESSRFGVEVGGEFKMSRSHQLIWTLSSSVEKNQYSGTASVTDPETGTATSGVSVMQGFTIFSLGYRWGQ